MSINKDEFNNIPIHYCKNCLSISIKRLTQNIDLCLDCNSTDIDSADFKYWDLAYEIEYGIKFINKKRNGKY